MMSRIYIASKARHAHLWRELRDAGVPIISTWIDEAGPGETSDFANLWERCIHESAECDALIVYREYGDVLKGAFIETGSALASGKPVYAVGFSGNDSFLNHPLVTDCSSVAHALHLIASR